MLPVLQGLSATMAGHEPDNGVRLADVNAATELLDEQGQTVSLGIRPIQAPDRPDLAMRRTASDRQAPYDTTANGPLMARNVMDLVLIIGCPRRGHRSSAACSVICGVCRSTPMYADE